MSNKVDAINVNQNLNQNVNSKPAKKTVETPKQKLIWTSEKEATGTTFKAVDENGKLVHNVFDENSNGVVDTQHDYDENGNCIKFTTFKNGEHDMTFIYEYDENGKASKINTDYDSDGQIDEVEHLEYDKFGKLMTRLVDSGADGSINEVYYQNKTPSEATKTEQPKKNEKPNDKNLFQIIFGISK